MVLRRLYVATQHCIVSPGGGRGRSVQGRPRWNIDNHALIDICPLIAKKEMSKILLDRPADRSPELLHTCIGFREIIQDRQTIIGIHRTILKESKCTAVKCVGSRLGYRVDDTAGRTPELGIELVCEYLKFLDGFESGPSLTSGSLTDYVVVVIRAVQQVVVIPR